MLETFLTCLVRVVISLCFIIPGYVLCKFKKASANHLSTLSTLLVYVCGPCMVIYAFYSASLAADSYGMTLGEMAIKMVYFFFATLILQGVFMMILYFVLQKKYDDAKYRMLTCGSVLGNCGFFGLPLVQSLVSNPIVSCYSSIYVLTMNLLIFTMGVFCLTNDRKYMSIKSAAINPTTFAMLIGILVFIFAEPLTFGGKVDIFWDAVNLLGKMTTPLCMIILGIRLAAVSFKKLWTRPFIYAICGLKLIVFPVFAFFAVYFLPFLDADLKASVLILSAVPCASVILSLAEIHHSEEELAANCVLVTTLLCFITIPIVTLLLNIL